MRVAVLANLHGNLPALKAVLAEIDRLAVDRIVLNCDIAAWPLPGETLDRLAELSEHAIWVHGNGERGLVAGFDHTADPTVHEHDLEVGGLLTRDQRDGLAGLPLTVTLEVDGLGTALYGRHHGRGLGGTSCLRGDQRDRAVLLPLRPGPAAVG
jgi:Calcineurin-like phosphoesterase superfamily domain